MVRDYIDTGDKASLQLRKKLTTTNGLPDHIIEMLEGDSSVAVRRALAAGVYTPAMPSTG